MKTIKYFGQSLTVPTVANFIATDANNTVWWYVKKPLKVMGGWSSGETCGQCCSTSSAKQWCKSLKEC